MEMDERKVIRGNPYFNFKNLDSVFKTCMSEKAIIKIKTGGEFLKPPNP